MNLEECYLLARQNYPLVKQYELIKKSREFTVQNAGKGYLPQIAINGQASYQSAVTAIPLFLPGVSIPELSKDQYKIYAEINQPLYDAGSTKYQKQLAEAGSITEEQKLEVELYKLKERINQVFFGILLIDGQLKQIQYLIQDLELNIQKTEASLKNGVALQSQVDLVRAELLKTQQRVLELRSTRKMFAEMLSMFINQTLDENTEMLAPPLLSIHSDITRPELKVFDQQIKNLEIQNSMIRSRTHPRFNIFFQGGFGRPALNMLSNSFEPYYIGGIRLNWNLTGFYTMKNDKALLAISRKNLDLQKELFLFNTGYSLKQYSSETDKYKALLLSDDEIIALRTNIKNTASAQLSNGVITSSDFLRELHAEQQAKETRLIHEIQFLLSQYNQQLISGN